MHTPLVTHTLKIYQRLYDRMPPFVPEQVYLDIEKELKNFFARQDATVSEVENSMMKYGEKIWPYVKAFEEMVKVHEHVLADKIFHQKASPRLRKKYALVCKLGHGFEPVCYGIALEHFDHDEKQELNELLVELKRDVRRYAMQAVLTHDKVTYQEKIDRYGKVVEEINVVLHSLSDFSNRERGDHGDLVHDMEGKIRAIQQSFAFLGPAIDIEEIRRMPEYYKGRKEERKMRWGK
jgi:Rad3-related DNA helicase